MLFWEGVGAIESLSYTNHYKSISYIYVYIHLCAHVKQLIHTNNASKLLVLSQLVSQSVSHSVTQSNDDETHGPAGVGGRSEANDTELYVINVHFLLLVCALKIMKRLKEAKFQNKRKDEEE